LQILQRTYLSFGEIAAGLSKRLEMKLQKSVRNMHISIAPVLLVRRGAGRYLTIYQWFAALRCPDLRVVAGACGRRP
jgi:hypothetical protein